MELSFISRDSAEASYLAQELETMLRKHGVSSKAVSLKQSSSENMDVGSVLSISLETLNQILGPVGTIATLASCVHQIMGKYNRDAVVDNGESRLKISASKVTLSGIKTSLARASKPKAKPIAKKKSMQAKVKSI